MRRSRQPAMSEADRVAAWEFKLSVQGKPCLVCGQVHPNMDAHHVVEQQELKDRCPDRLWDRANAAPLCPSMSPPCRPCHPNHTNAARRIPIRALSAENVAFASEVLGEFAPDYLGRRYGTSESVAA